MKTTSDNIKASEWYVHVMFVSAVVYSLSNGHDPDDVFDSTTALGRKSPHFRDIAKLATELCDHGVRLALTGSNVEALRFLAGWGEEYRPHLRDCILLAAENHTTAPGLERVAEQVGAEREKDSQVRSKRAKAGHKKRKAAEKAAAKAK